MGWTNLDWGIGVGSYKRKWYQKCFRILVLWTSENCMIDCSFVKRPVNLEKSWLFCVLKIWKLKWICEKWSCCINGYPWVHPYPHRVGSGFKILDPFRTDLCWTRIWLTRPFLAHPPVLPVYIWKACWWLASRILHFIYQVESNYQIK